MTPSSFDYHRVTTVADAIAMLQLFPDDGKIIAGGHSLLPAMKLRLSQPGNLIDIAGISELRGIALSADVIEVGALTTHREIERSDILQHYAPLLVETAATVGDTQVRNRGTIGGALSHADPAADYPATALALEVDLIAEGKDGKRTIPISEFFVDLFTTSLAPDEILTTIRIPIPPAGTGYSYQKLANQASGYAIVGIAATMALAPDGTVAKARIGITGAVASAVRARGTEAALEGGVPTTDVIESAARLATDGLDLLDDIHASTSYRERVTRGLTSRAISVALNRATR